LSRKGRAHREKKVKATYKFEINRKGGRGGARKGGNSGFGRSEENFPPKGKATGEETMGKGEDKLL